MQRLNRSAIHLLPLFFLVIIFPACKSKTDAAKTAPKETPPVVVDVIIGQPQPITNVVEANGTVIAQEFVELHPEVSGRLTYLNFAEGKPIAQGTVIARVNDADLRAQIGKSKVQLQLAEKTVERYKPLLDINGINQADYDAVVNQVNGYKADIVYTQALIDKTVIRAPFSGIGGLRQVSPGAYVTPATVIATLQQTKQVKIDFTLPEMYSNIIKTGAMVDVELDAATKEKSKALIIAVEPGANTDTRNLKVRAVLKEGSSNPGAFVKVYIDAGKSRSSIKVPTNCLIPDDKNNQVVLVKNGKANFVNVTTGIREANTVEILKGIEPGDSIVVTGVLFARPKSALKVRSVKKLEDLNKTAEGNQSF
ncbi:efflux RND transporter periplasmic adaptor subunit [Ferruginibacter sp. SUN106]|uniref:efflux RND transporter periplasmic adaptor subunit n=1 Tax=Ferruginibacter sp. SUN106 TaxID=2978348 RepID=UPI003D36F195